MNAPKAATFLLAAATTILILIAGPSDAVTGSSPSGSMTSVAWLPILTGDDGPTQTPGPFPNVPPRRANRSDAIRFRKLSLQDENGVIPPDGLVQAADYVKRMRAAQAPVQAEAAGISRPG